MKSKLQVLLILRFVSRFISKFQQLVRLLLQYMSHPLECNVYAGGPDRKLFSLGLNHLKCSMILSIDYGEKVILSPALPSPGSIERKPIKRKV